jgi:hypothetical protein
MDETQQIDAERAISGRAAELLREHNVGFLYGSLACGSDLVLAETALELQLEFNAVLPFDMEKFVETSVRVGDVPGKTGKWERRFHHVLANANSLMTLEPGEPVDRNLDCYFFHCFRYAAGSALQRAAMLQTDVRLIAVSDEEQPDNIAGTNQALSDWQRHNRAIDIIPYTGFRPRSSGLIAATTAFRPVIFLWEATEFTCTERKISERSLRFIARGLDSVDQIHSDGRHGICLIAGSTQRALELASAIVEQEGINRPSSRVICDFGRVFGGDGSPDKKLVGRLQAANDLLGTPLDQVSATEAFAMQAKFDLGERVIMIPVSRAEPYRLRTEGRNRPSLPIYMMHWAHK